MSKDTNLKSRVMVRRDARSGHFIGRAEDGTAIAKPTFKPKSFTVRELRKVIREVQQHEPQAKAG